jgi:hypothetical protein
MLAFVTEYSLVDCGAVHFTNQAPVPVEEAAELLPDLQDREGHPLTGDALEDAAEKFAEGRNLRVVVIDPTPTPAPAKAQPPAQKAPEAADTTDDQKEKGE